MAVRLRITSYHGCVDDAGHHQRDVYTGAKQLDTQRFSQPHQGKFGG